MTDHADVLASMKAVTVPDPLPLRNIEVPREVTAVEGCDCGGMTFHRAQTVYDPPGSGCALWSLPTEQARAAVEAAEDRLSEFTARGGQAMTWKEVAARYPEFVQWIVQRHGPLPDGEVKQEDWERFAREYEGKP